MILSEFVYIMDRNIDVIFKTVGDADNFYTWNTLPINFLARDIAFITIENYEDIEELNGELLTVYTFDNNGYVEIYLPNGEEATLWTDGSAPRIEMFVDLKNKDFLN